jgi:hypothetical protein
MADSPDRDDPGIRLGRAWLGLRTTLALTSIAAVTMVLLFRRGQPWWCRCGRLAPWSGEIWSGHNSQHLADPYTLSHLLHGLVFFAVLRPLARWLGLGPRLVLAGALEAAWELFENAPAVIERYRTATMALGYSGDSLLNSLGDIASCGLGFWLAARLPARWSVALFLAVEVGMLAVYRDCLVLNVLMLVHPVGAIKSWQTGAAS